MPTPAIGSRREFARGAAAILLASAVLLGPFVSATGAARPQEFSGLAEAYLERYFDFYPTRATEAGRHDLDARLEDLSRERRAAWLSFNREIASRLEGVIEDPASDAEDRADAGLLLRRARREIHELATLRRPERDPLYWSSPIGNATVFLLVREELPLEARVGAAAARASQLPRLAAQARAALGATHARQISPEIARIAASQVRSAGEYYRTGLPELARTDAPLHAARAMAAGAAAADALGSLAAFLDSLASVASGSFRLGGHYAETFRLGTGIEQPLSEVLARAEADLVAKRAETAAYGRTVWQEVFPAIRPPAADRELISRLFERVAADHADSLPDFIADYQQIVARLETFIREREIITLPDPLSIWIGRSPAYLWGQSVGGIYTSGPYAPQAPTLWFLPTPPDDATPEQRAAFYRDFNHHFNVMITPHEVMPGHYVQLKYAALNPRKVRAVFADDVFVEGWGTFSERLLLDLGWGGPLDRLAHLKKQLENIARTIVDIRVHTTDIPREEVLRFVREEALQDEQFAANMWTRALTSSPQLTTYYLGYRQVMGLYEDVRRARGESFRLREFMDEVMALSGAPVEHLRRHLLGPSAAGSPASGTNPADRGG